MPNPKKKPRLVGPAAGSTVATRRSRRLAGRPCGTIALANVVVEHIFAYLPPDDIMRSRRVCQRWKDAAKKTIVPIDEFRVETIMKYGALMAMSTAMPNLAQISLCDLDHQNQIMYSDGEEPDESRAANATIRYAVRDFPETISSFRMLRVLELLNAPLNGRYPFLFDFPVLESFKIVECKYFKWDLEMLAAGMPILKVLHVMCNGQFFTGNINSLRALKNTFERVKIEIQSAYFSNIVGNFMDLADFPRLQHLYLSNTGVTGDVRDIDEEDFPVLKYVSLPKTVYGGMRYRFQRISELSEFVSVVDRIRRQRDMSTFALGKGWSLANDSPDRYSMDHLDVRICYPPPPFTLELVSAGSRTGWRWKNGHNECCEVNWLDPEPERGSCDYEEYITDLKKLEYGIYFYKGYHQPPTEAEYRLLCEDRSRLRVIH